MRSSLVLGVVLAVTSAGELYAHEPETLPTAEPFPLQPVPAKSEFSGDEVEHLLKAAQHLDSAGLKEEAHRLRSVARERALRGNVVARKEEELECLLAEIDELRNLTGEPRAVLIRVAAIEFSRAALGDKAAELDAILGRDAPELTDDESQHRPRVQPTGIPGYSFNGNPPLDLRHTIIQASAPRRGMPNSIVEGNPLVHPVFRELHEKRLISILAEPTVVTTSGRPVSFLSGGQIPIPVKSADGGVETKWKPFGVQLKARANVMAGRRVRLQANFEISEQDLRHVVNVDGIPVPALSTRGISTETELRFGQTVVLGGLTSRRAGACETREGVVERLVAHLATKTAGAPRDATSTGADDLREMVVLITAETVDASSPAHKPVQLIPSEIDPDEMRRLLSPAGVPDDVQYFPASPIPRKGTLR